MLAEYGVLDFAGGIVVHETAGIGALACVFFLGTRKVKDREPHNIPFVALGTAMLWFGWFGFNAGSSLGSNEVAGLAFINTQLGAAFAAVTWMFIEWRRSGKPTVVGFMVGAIAGLATVTPAAGFVSPSSAMLIGVAAGLICYGAVQVRIRMKWDDALDVWGVHGIGGIIGTLLLGVLGSTVMNPGGADGLLHGGVDFFVVQLVAVAGTGIYAFIVTYVLLAIINVITPVRVDLEAEESGLDQALHGETAYLES
jgi:Amt family ammonium transporter